MRGIFCAAIAASVAMASEAEWFDFGSRGGKVRSVGYKSVSDGYEEKIIDEHDD